MFDETKPSTASPPAHAGWSAAPVARRLGVVGRLRRRIGDSPLELAGTVNGSWRAGPSETLTAEILPLLDAVRFLEREAASLLAPRWLGRRRRPFWLFGSAVETRREPYGVVLVIGPANYPVLLPGVQALQALVAGNTVLVKPGRGGLDPMRWIAGALRDAGLPEGVLQVLSEDVEDATAAIEAGVDKVVLTGSAATGRAVLRQLADHLTPAVVELSGRDAVVVRRDADLDLVTRAVLFGVTFNGGFTCIAPRRLLVHREVAAEVGQRLANAAAGSIAPEVNRRLRELLSSLTPVAGDGEALRHIAECPYRLGASVFGREPGATELARRADVGIAVVNDMVVPTADPRIAFGGRGMSGFGVTRGAQGLLEMTVSKTVVVRGGRFRPHFEPTGPADVPIFDSFIRATHGSTLPRRLRGVVDLVRAGRRRGSG